MPQLCASSFSRPMPHSQAAQGVWEGPCKASGRRFGVFFESTAASPFADIAVAISRHEMLMGVR